MFLQASRASQIKINILQNQFLFKVESFTISDEYELIENEEKDWNASSYTAHSEPMAVKEVSIIIYYDNVTCMLFQQKFIIKKILKTEK